MQGGQQQPLGGVPSLTFALGVGLGKFAADLLVILTALIGEMSMYLCEVTLAAGAGCLRAQFYPFPSL